MLTLAAVWRMDGGGAKLYVRPGKLLQGYKRDACPKLWGKQRRQIKEILGGKTVRNC